MLKARYSQGNGPFCFPHHHSTVGLRHAGLSDTGAVRCVQNSLLANNFRGPAQDNPVHAIRRSGVVRVQSSITTKGITMKLTKILLAAAVAAATLPAVAQVSVNIHVPGLIQVAPPAPRYEPVPRPRSGQVWVPGHWQWNDRAYAWRPGYYVAARPDYAYAPGGWVRADGGWRWREGNWRRAERREARRHDRDHDRYDHDDDHRGGGHCPPGQAKKGRC